jgi:hypothetical protein
MLMLQLAPDQPAHLSRAGAAPADADLPAGRWTPLRWTAPPAEGLALTLAVPPTGSLHLRWAAELDRWPTGVEPAPAPPPEVMATGRSGMTLVTGSRRLTW